MKAGLLVALICLFVPLSVAATPYVPPDMASQASQGSEEWLPPQAHPTGTALAYDPYQRFGMCCQFISTLQVSDPLSPDYGGMREAEHMLNVIQTDNTSESIWMWSHFYRLSGSDVYGGYVNAAWQYVMSHKAYNEEGNDDPLTGYYRRYNCAWALRAVMEYSDVYGDPTYAAYGDSCASYLCHNPMIINVAAGAARRLNGMIMAWAVGNLYEYGQYVANSTYTSKALAIADSVKVWAEVNPNKFHWKEWAMDGGVVMWGIVHSVFADDPTGLGAWAGSYASYLDTEVDPTAGNYQNAWRAWAALGQSTAADVLDSPTYAGYFKHLADTLVANDGDNDGGIPVLDSDPDNYDQSWVTSYLGFMCMDRMFASAGAPAASLSQESGRGVRVSQVPSRGFPSLILNLTRASRVAVSVYDASGRRVAEQDAGLLGQGSHSLPLGQVSGLTGMSSGIYFYEVRSGAEIARGKMVLLR